MSSGCSKKKGKGCPKNIFCQLLGHLEAEKRVRQEDAWCLLLYVEEPERGGRARRGFVARQLCDSLLPLYVAVSSCMYGDERNFLHAGVCGATRNGCKRAALFSYPVHVLIHTVRGLPHTLLVVEQNRS
eukprot:6047571-Amphidinium_carterae.1